MKKSLPYILIVIALLVGAGIFVQLRTGNKSLLNVSLLGGSKTVSGTSTNTSDQGTGPKFVNLGQAPEFTGITKWLNSDPLTMESLKGKVVLVDFWTYSCINCIRTLPYITKWYEQYKDQGFVVIGVHTPEFAFEKVTSNVESALKRYNINYPVAQDNNYKTWGAFNNQFWPAHYLIDKNGDIVYTHFGEGEYDNTEKAIRTLLGLEGDVTMPQAEETNQAGTQETYLGSARLSNFGGTETPSADEQVYAFPKKLAKNKFALEGSWKIEPEAAVHTQGFGRIRFNFTAAKVFMVAESSEPTTIKIYVDGKLQKGVTISNSDLYPLYDSAVGANHTMEVEFPQGGVQVFTFTFG